MEKELPKGWVETTIGNLATIVGGGTPNSSIEHYFEGDIGWVTPADLSKYNEMYISSGRRSITEEALKSCSARLMPKGTVLFSSRAPIGYVVIASGPISTNQGFKSLIPNNAYIPELAYYYLKMIKPLAESYASGTTFLELSGKKMAELPFPLPPKPEQERIVAKLDSLFAELERVKVGLAKIPVLMKSFRQAVLTQAVTGKLTEEWRVGKELGEWEESTIGSLSKSISGYAFKSSDFVDEGIQLIRMGNLYNNKLDLFRNAVYLPSNFDNNIVTKYRVKKDDILLSLTGTKYKRDYGFAIKVENDFPLLLNQRILALRPNLNVDYFLYLLRDNIFRDQFFELETGGVNQGNVGVKGILSILIPVPPLKEQEEIVRRVEVLFAQADAIEARYRVLKEKIEHLPQAILAKAFRGELVEQLPTDGDARELLEEIKKMKAGLVGKKVKEKV